MSSNTILFEKTEGIGKITLNRPSVYNSFNREMSKAVQDCLEDCKTDPGIRAVYLRGSGKAFSAGQDLVEATDPNGPDIKRIVEEHYNPIILAIRTIEKPVVAAVNGVAAGAGANIALACDVAVATRSAKFVQAFSSIGLIPDSGGTFILPRLVGWQRASALMMLADKIDAEEAQRIGMIYRWYEDDEFDAEAWKIAVKLASLPTRGLGYTKRLLNASYHNDLKDHLRLEGQVQVMAAATDDFTEGVAAFLEKRKPEFKGE